MNKVRMFLAVVLAAMLVGCANSESIHRSMNINLGEGALIDGKQRAILVKRQRDKTNKANKTVIVCAEPVPDIMSALSGSIAADLGFKDEIKMGISGSSHESAASIGLRTQSITLLRDSLYRLCESYMNGAISASEYNLQSRRYQKYMVVLLAIEQIAGTVKAPTVAITSQSSAEAAQSLLAQRNILKKVNAELDDLQSDIETLEAEKNTVENDAKKANEIQKKLDALGKERKELLADKKFIEEGINHIRGSTSSGETKVAVGGDLIHSGKTDAYIQTIANAIGSITMNILGTSDLEQICLQQLSDNDYTKLLPMCRELVRAQLDSLSTNTELLQKVTEEKVAYMKEETAYMKERVAYLSAKTKLLNKQAEAKLPKISKNQTDSIGQQVIEAQINKKDEKKEEYSPSTTSDTYLKNLMDYRIQGLKTYDFSTEGNKK